MVSRHLGVLDMLDKCKTESMLLQSRTMPSNSTSMRIRGNVKKIMSAAIEPPINMITYAGMSNSLFMRLIPLHVSPVYYSISHPTLQGGRYKSYLHDKMQFSADKIAKRLAISWDLCYNTIY